MWALWAFDWPSRHSNNLWPEQYAGVNPRFYPEGRSTTSMFKVGFTLLPWHFVLGLLDSGVNCPRKHTTCLLLASLVGNRWFEKQNDLMF